MATPTHSFLSSDPVIYNLESNKEEDKKRFNGILNNPQLQNSYAYAGNNPVVNIDKDGRYVETSFSAVGGGWAGSFGIRMDNNGVDFFLAGGTGYGLSGGIGLSWAPGQSLSHERGANLSINGTAGEGLGGFFSQNINSYSVKTNSSVANGDPVFGLGLGYGYSASVMQEVSAPISPLVWGKTSSQTKPDGQNLMPTTIGMPTTENSSKKSSSKTNPSLKSPVNTSSRNSQSRSSPPSSKNMFNNLSSRLLNIFKK